MTADLAIKGGKKFNDACSYIIFFFAFDFRQFFLKESNLSKIGPLVLG